MKRHLFLQMVFFTFLFVVGGIQETRAQYCYFGVRGGMNISNYRGRYKNGNYETKISPVAGLVAGYQKNEKLAFFAEVNYDVRGAKYNQIVEDGIVYKTEYKDIVQAVNYLNIPLMARFGLGEKEWFYSYAGLYGGFVLSAHIKGKQVITNKFDPSDVVETPVDKDYKNEMKTFDMGAVIGVGVDFRVARRMDILADLRYNWGWLNTAPQGQGQLYNTVWSFNLALVYKLTKKTGSK